MLKSRKPTETEVLTTISVDHSRARYVSRTGVQNTNIWLVPLTRKRGEHVPVSPWFRRPDC